MEPTLRIIALGGLNEIGINMMAYEFGNDIIVVDMGIGFPGEILPGVQYILPNPHWLEQNKDRIRGLVLTHGHMDHIGAIPYILPKIGFPPIYSMPLSIGVVERRMEEFNSLDRAQYNVLSPDDTLRLGNFTIRFFRVNHSIPDAVGLSIATPIGQVIHTGDWKLDYTPGDDYHAELDKLARFAGEGVLALLSDSTNSRIPGYSLSEHDLANTINAIFDEAKARIIFTCNALILTRIQQMFHAAARHNRKVAVFGYSMVKNIEVAISLGYLKIQPGIIIKSEQLRKFPDKALVILTTGGQGEANAGLTRMSRGDHRNVRLKKGDTAVVSANPIPGNERPLQNMVTGLTKQGIHVVYHKMLDVHTSGHARQEELKLMINLVKPKYFVPIHGEQHMLITHGKLAESIGMPAENILVASNGAVLKFAENSAVIAEEMVPAGYLFVNESGFGTVEPDVQNDRRQMQNEGMVTIVGSYDSKAKKLAKPVQILSRGFVYVKNNDQLFNELSHELQKLLSGNFSLSTSGMEPLIADYVGDYLLQKTGRRPLVSVLIIEKKIIMTK